MNILYITKHNPWGQGGGAIASGMYLNAFLELFKESNIDLCISDLIPENSIPKTITDNERINIYRAKARPQAARILSPLSKVTHRFQNIGKKLLRQKAYSYCVFDHSSIAGTLIKFVPKGTNAIVIHHNYEPDYFFSNCTNTIIRSLLLPSVRKNEKIAYTKANVNVFLTTEDKESFKQHYGEGSGRNIVTGLFESDNAQATVPIENLNISCPTIVISGSLNNIQNTEGIEYFINQLYPLIPSHYKIIISGQKPNETILNLVKRKPNIELIPNPNDMSEIVRKGNIFMSPAKSGSGIKVRITDGLKVGLPVIAHEVSARGYGDFIKKGFFKSFSTPDEFHTKLTELVHSIEENEIRPIEIVSLYKSVCSLEAAVLKIKKAILSD